MTLEFHDGSWSMDPMAQHLVLALMGLSLVACGDKDVDASGDDDSAALGDDCAVLGGDAPACNEGLACEPIAGDADGRLICAQPLEIRGQVFDALDGSPLEGALVAALDETGAPVSDVAVTDAAGAYALRVSARRDAAGEVVDALKWTLFSTAADYQPFPAGIRPALPVNAVDAVPDDAAGDSDDGGGTGADDTVISSVIENQSTRIGLIPLTADQRGGRTISGHVGRFADLADDELPQGGGTLVVAEGVVPARYTIADISGAYRLFNVPDGAANVTGYRQGLVVTPAPAGDGDIVDLDLVVDDDATESMPAVTGSVNIVNAPGGSLTSVVLVPVSVYNDALERGPVPFGLRAPQAPQAPSIDGAFEISRVPPGDYKVLAAFENDDLVRDPDTGISGTDIPEITVRAQTLNVDSGFKITEHLEVISPGANAPEVVDGAPTFVFADDSSEDRYEVVVYDALGTLVWEDRNVPGVSGSDTVEVQFGGGALTPGMYYQFRATSWKDNPNGSSAISRTEDLRGVFVAPGE